jgi:hypothetical protein
MLTFKSHTKTVELLLDKGGANPDIKDKNGETALDIARYDEIKKIFNPTIIDAARRGRTDVVKLLLDKGTNVDMQNNYGQTALMWAASEGHTEIVKLLLDKGANPVIKDKNGKTALYFAKNDEIKKLLNSPLGPLGNLVDVTIVKGDAIQNVKCAICQYPLKDGRVVVKTNKCNHQFHAKCLNGAKDSGTRKCPLCRQENAFFGKSARRRSKSKKRRSMRRRSKSKKRRSMRRRSKRRSKTHLAPNQSG